MMNNYIKNLINIKKRIKDLNDKISKRESRQEDLETIKTLKRQLADYEEKFKRLTVNELFIFIYMLSYLFDKLISTL